MPNEFVARNGIIAQNNSTVSGSLTVTQDITGSLFGTASFATSASRAVSASFATSASWAPSSGWGLTGNSDTTGSINFVGTIDAQDFVVRTNNLRKLIITNDGATGEPLLITNGGGATSFFVTAARKSNNQPSLFFQATNTFVNGVNGNVVLQGTNVINSYWGGLYSNIIKPVLINESAAGATAPASLFQLSKAGINTTQSDAFGITLSTPDAALL